jgi:Fanconi anemia group M protein
MQIKITHWKSPDRKRERIYLEAPGHPKVFGEKRSGDQVLWAGPEITAAEAMSLAAILLEGPLPDWEGLKSIAESRGAPSQRASGGFNRGGWSGSHGGRKGSTLAELTYRSDPYTAADTGSLDATRMSHPIPEPTKILVDHREPAAIAEALAQIPNLEVEVTTLDVGDYMVPGRFVIERKTTTDFHQSMTEDAKRMFFQTNAMVELEIPSLIIIEGGACAQRSMQLNAIYGTLTYLSLIQGIPILETLDHRSTVYMIAKAVRHVCYGLGYDVGLRASAPKKAAKIDPLAGASYTLESIHGVSATRARALLRHFGSLVAVGNADVAALRAVEGIGPGTAKAIYETFNTKV